MDHNLLLLLLLQQPQYLQLWMNQKMTQNQSFTQYQINSYLEKLYGYIMILPGLLELSAVAIICDLKESGYIAIVGWEVITAATESLDTSLSGITPIPNFVNLPFSNLLVFWDKLYPKPLIGWVKPTLFGTILIWESR